MSFHVIYKAPCGLCLRNMSEIQHYLFQTNCDFIFLEMFCLDPYVLVDRPFQPQRPFYYIPDITSGREDIPLSCVNEIDSTPPPKVAYSKSETERCIGGCSGLSSFKVPGVHDRCIKWSKWSFSSAKAAGIIRCSSHGLASPFSKVKNVFLKTGCSSTPATTSWLAATARTAAETSEGDGSSRWLASIRAAGVNTSFVSPLQV